MHFGKSNNNNDNNKRRGRPTSTTTTTITKQVDVVRQLRQIAKPSRGLQEERIDRSQMVCGT